MMDVSEVELRIYGSRRNMMIIIDMDQEALPAYDASEPHLRWKTEYGKLTEKKAIFDCDE